MKLIWLFIALFFLSSCDQQQSRDQNLYAAMQIICETGDQDACRRAETLQPRHTEEQFRPTRQHRRVCMDMIETGARWGVETLQAPDRHIEVDRTFNRRSKVIYYWDNGSLWIRNAFGSSSRFEAACTITLLNSGITEYEVTVASDTDGYMCRKRGLSPITC